MLLITVLKRETMDVGWSLPQKRWKMRAALGNKAKLKIVPVTKSPKQIKNKQSFEIILNVRTKYK